MSNQDFGRDPSTANRTSDGLGPAHRKSSERRALDRVRIGRRGGDQSQASRLGHRGHRTEQVKQLLDHQVSGGADMVGHFAGAAKRAAEELDRDAPQLAGLVRTAADRMDGYANGLRDQSVQQLMRAASDFTAASRRWSSDWRHWRASSRYVR